VTGRGFFIKHAFRRMRGGGAIINVSSMHSGFKSIVPAVAASGYNKMR